MYLFRAVIILCATAPHQHGTITPPTPDEVHERLGLTGLAEENLQSRLRGTMLMAVSNQEGQ
ncbi:hypothetical protein ACWEM1_20135, partial [Streptomyces sp. NPDC004491]